MCEYCVYKHTSPSGKVYIGITKQNPITRWGNGGRNYYKNVYFWRAIQKYGWDNFKHEILYDNLDKESACQKEIELIAQHSSQNSKFGYNNSTGGEAGGAGLHLSESVIEHLREIHTGKPLTAEHRNKLRLAKLGKKRGPQSEETVRKRIETRRRNGTLSRGPMPESEKQMRRKITANYIPPNAQSVFCVELNETFPTIYKAAKKTGAERANISAVCRGKLKTTAGYHWNYTNNLKE